MGKAKRNRGKAKAENPTGIPSVRDIEREEEELTGNGDVHMSQQEYTIEALFEMLQSGKAEDKVIGLQTLATVFNAPETVECAVRHKVVKIAAPLLFDNSTAVRNAAAGALRNLSACGSPEICDLLVEEDVMTPLTALLQKYASDWQPSKQKVENKLDEMTDTFQQAVHLLWNLCESNSTALKYFNQGNLLPVLAKCLEVSIFGIDTAIVVAHCLHTVTEENPTAVAKLQDSNLIIQNLLQLEGSEYSVLLLRTLACGLVLDLSYGKLSSLAPPVVTELLCNLSNILSVDHRKTLNAFTSTLPLDGETETSAQHEELLKSIKEMQYLLEAQQVAIELLANICSSDDADEKMDEDTSDVSSDEIISDIVMDEENCMSSDEKSPLSVSSEVLEAIVSGSLVLKVWEKTRLPAENVCQILNEHSEGKHLLNKLETLRCRALLCLNNLLAALDMQYLGGPLQVHEMFNNIVDTLHKEKDSGKVEFLESATSALRATLQKLAEFQFIDLNLTEEDLQSTFDTHRECPFPNVRSNLLRSIGLLGMNYSKSMVDDSQAKLRMVGEYLLYVCTRESELWVVAEAVDAIMDIFGEDCTDLAAAQIGLVEKLRVLLAPLKNKARLQRKSLGDHYLVVSTVNANLGRFIKYKSERISLIGSQ